jgi:predicted SAM-dependent methyltransferase
MSEYKLNLGCADDLKEGYINIDLHPEDYPQYKGKILGADALCLPFYNNSIDEIYASHLIEHFHYTQIPTAFAEWYRILRLGGKLIIIVPDMDIIAQQWTISPMSIQMNYWNFAIYGSFRATEQVHKSAWNAKILENSLFAFNFRDVKTYHDKYIFWLWGVAYK